VTDEYSTDAGPAAPTPTRHRGGLLALAGTTTALLAVIAIEVAASSGPEGSTAPAQAVAAATRHATALTSVSATLVEYVGARAAIRGRFAEQRSPFLESIAVTDAGAGKQLPVSAILTSSAVYLKLGASLPATPEASWLKADLSALGDGSPAASMLQTLTGDNPMSALTTLADGRHLRAVGTRAVGGVAATGYSGAIALAPATRFLPASSQALFGSELGAIRGDVEFTVWIDRSHRVRELTETGRVGAAIARATITFYGFNQPVTIKVPPASQVVNLGGGHVSIS
jgi:hypothetical protein